MLDVMLINAAPRPVPATRTFARPTDQANHASVPDPDWQAAQALRQFALKTPAQDWAVQAHDLGKKYSIHSGSDIESLYTTAAAVAGSEPAAEAARLTGVEFDNNYSEASSAIFTLAAAIAGDRPLAEAAFAQAQRWMGDAQPADRALMMAAAALSPDPEKLEWAAATARSFGADSNRARALFTAACVVAGDDDKVGEAFRTARSWNRGDLDQNCALFMLAYCVAESPEEAHEIGLMGNERTVALRTLAAAIAGDRASAEKAYRMGNEFDHQNGEESSARFMVGVAAALNPTNRKFALVYPQ